LLEDVAASVAPTALYLSNPATSRNSINQDLPKTLQNQIYSGWQYRGLNLEKI